MIKLTGSTVIVNGDNVERALRKFKKKIQDCGKLIELREREFYEKPTTTRKKKRAQARKRWHRELNKQALPKKLY